jgi:hypothetical protein
MKGNAVCGAVLLLAYVVASPAQTDPGLSIKPAGVTLSGEKIGPEKPPVNLSRPEMRQKEILPTSLGAEFADAASRGEAWAQTRLGKLYLEAPGAGQSLGQGISLLQEAAAKDDSEALFLLATLTAAGHGVEQSEVEAFAKMKRAAELGWRDAQFALGAMHFVGRGANKDETAALESFLQAVQQEHVEAMFSAGRILLSKSDPEQRREGLGLMGRAIDNGHIEATLMLATAYGRGSLGMPKDESQAEAILQPAAERGNADCQFALASLYKFGDSFAARRDEAQVWLQRAADKGQPEAAEALRAEKR